MIMPGKKTSRPMRKGPQIDGGRISPEDRFLAEVKEAVTKNLKVLRIHADLTAKELAEAAGIGHSMLKAIEAGNRPLQIHQAFRIAKETGSDLASLVTGEVLREWGGKALYSSESYRKWLGNGKSPSEEQRASAFKLLERRVDQSIALAHQLGADYEAYLAANLSLFIDAFYPEPVHKRG